jgi:hypothetical protein
VSSEADGYTHDGISTPDQGREHSFKLRNARGEAAQAVMQPSVRRTGGTVLSCFRECMRVPGGDMPHGAAGTMQWRSPANASDFETTFHQTSLEAGAWPAERVLKRPLDLYDRLMLPY